MGAECTFERCRARSKAGLPPCDLHCPRNLDPVLLALTALLTAFSLVSCLL